MAIQAKSTEQFDGKLEEALKNISPDAKKAQEPDGEQGDAPSGEKETVSQGDTPPEDNAPQGDKPTDTPADKPTEDQPAPKPEEPLADKEGSLSRLNELQQLSTDLQAERDKLSEEYDSLKAKYEEAKELLDPRKHFVNEEEYKRQLILQQHGAELNPALLNKIIGTDLEAIDAVDVLVLAELAANPNIIGGEAGAREMIYQQLNVDPEETPNEWSQLTKNVIAKAANNARRELSKIKNIEVPEKIDFDSQRAESTKAIEDKKAELQQSWSDIAGNVVQGFNTLDLSRETKEGNTETYFSYNIDDQFKKDATDLVVQYMADSGSEPTKENLREAGQYVQDLFIRKNFNNIVQAYGNDIEAKLIEKYNLEQDNPKPPNDAEAPETEADKEKQALIDYVMEDLKSNRRPGDKLM